jgi:hypothetical protein
MTKFAQGQFGNGPGPQFSYDDRGGLWLPMLGPDGGTSYLVHYFDGKLTRAALPVAADKITIGAVSQVVPGPDPVQHAAGFTHAAGHLDKNVVGVVLKYS